MKYIALLALIATPLAAADEMRLALMLRAQSEFDRVELAGVAQLADAAACVQSQAAALAVASPSEASLLHYRKGFCLLAEAAVTHRPEQYREAAAEFDSAIEAWPVRLPAGNARNAVAEPVSPGLRVLAAIARLEAAPAPAGPDAALEQAQTELASSVTSPVCSSNVMGPAFCQQVVQKGREWLGWMALERSDAAGNWSSSGIALSEAVRDSTGSTDGWADWTAGRQAFASGSYPAAVEHYQAAISRWEAERHESAPTILETISPHPDFAAALADLGGAEFLAGNSSAAVATLDRAVHEDASRARPLYLRARAREAGGDTAGALTDYNLASRAAFASAKDLASGEAHFYRGILLYRRKDAARAEDEFASALNFEIPAALRADAQAWRHLAAVASGSCGASRGYLERSLASVSPYFPKAEALALVQSCPAATARGAGEAAPND